MVAAPTQAHVSVDCAVPDDRHRQYKSLQRNTQALTWIKAGYDPREVTKKMGLNCMELGWMPMFLSKSSL